MIFHFKISSKDLRASDWLDRHPSGAQEISFPTLLWHNSNSEWLFPASHLAPPAFGISNYSKLNVCSGWKQSLQWVRGNKTFMLMKPRGTPHCSGLLYYKNLSYKIPLLRFILQVFCWPFITIKKKSRSVNMFRSCVLPANSIFPGYCLAALQ